MWMAWLRRRFPRLLSRQILRWPEDTSIGAVPLTGGEVIAAGEAGHVAGGADHDGRHDRAHAEDLGKGGARCGDRHGQLLFGIAHLGAGAAQVLNERCGELAPGCLHRPRWRAGLQETSGVSGGESPGNAAGDQLTQHGMQPARDLGAGAAQIPVAPGPYLQHCRVIIGRDFPAGG